MRAIVIPIMASLAFGSAGSAEEVKSAEEILADLLEQRKKGLGARAKDGGASKELSVQVHFAKNSAIIRAEAKQQLEEMCKALSSPESGKVSIIGHTDAQGSDAYNLTLSESRALAVVTHLVDECGVQASKLAPKGMGEAQLVDRENPYGDRNRRVEIKAIN